MKSLLSLEFWKQDVPASIVVFLVALPLCLGIALASNAPPMAGIIAGVVGGIVVGAISGSTVGVSGPAAGLTAIVIVGIQQLGSFEAFLLAVVLAGAIQILLSVLRAGIIAYYFPSAVIKGMLAGIGVIIMLKQIPHAVGYDRVPLGDESFDQPDRENTFSELSHMMESFTPGAFVITAVCLLLMILWERPAIQRNAWLRYIPGPLLAVVIGIVLAGIFDGIPALFIAPEHFVAFDDVRGLDAFTLPDLGRWNDRLVWTTALTIALVASIETLLCVEATDKLDPHKRTTPANRELYAQGIGNMVSGMLGGLPLTQVVVRSSANIQSGGRTKLSTMLHGLFIAIAVVSLAPLLRSIPFASLAAVLLLVGYKLAKPALFVSMWKAGRIQFIQFAVTVGFMAVTNDLLRGVALGLAVAFVHILWKNYKVPFHFHKARQKPGLPVYIELSEDVTFLNKAGIKRALSELAEGSRVVIDATRTVDLDPDVLEIITDFTQVAAERNIRYELLGFKGDLAPRTITPTKEPWPSRPTQVQ